MAKTKKYKIDKETTVKVDEEAFGKLKEGGEDFDTTPETVRISLVMEWKLLQEIKDNAQKRKIPYQTYLKKMLREKLIEGDISGKTIKPTFTRFENQYNEDMKICLISK